MDDQVNKFQDIHKPIVLNLKKPTTADAEMAVKTLIEYIGDDPTREGLRDTPARVAKAMLEMFVGYGDDSQTHLDKVFTETEQYDEFVLVKNIDFFSHCEHHMVPFFGKAHIAYIPLEGVVGLSKLARTVDCFAKRLQTQEKLTSQIWQALDFALKTSGIAVLLEAQHLCMSMRGITKKDATTITSKFSGEFKDDYNKQLKFLSLIKS